MSVRFHSEPPGHHVKHWQFLITAIALATLTNASRRRWVSEPASDRVRRLDGAARTSGGDAPDPYSGDAPSMEPIDPGRGRMADSPGEIPKRGWRDVLRRVKEQIGEDNVSLTAAGIAYGWLLAIFPLLGSLIAIYGVVADPADVQRQVESLLGLLSPDVVDTLHDQLTKLTQKSGAALSFGALFGILFSLWSANAGTKAMISALNIVYSEKEKRGFFTLNVISLSMTIGMVIAAVAALLLTVILPVAFGVIGMKETVETALNILRWPVLAIGFLVWLAVLYRYAPSREKPRWRWVTWGSTLATVLWIIASAGFAIYVANFGKYDETYGSLGAVVILMMWFYITAFIILLGAELNAELEHQTARDSTTEPQKPMGQRGAHMADTLGK